MDNNILPDSPIPRKVVLKRLEKAHRQLPFEVDSQVGCRTAFNVEVVLDRLDDIIGELEKEYLEHDKVWRWVALKVAYRYYEAKRYSEVEAKQYSEATR